MPIPEYLVAEMPHIIPAAPTEAAVDFQKLTGISHGYWMDATETATTIYTEDGTHKFSFDPRVPMVIVHIIAEAHKAGMAAAKAEH